MKNVLSSFVILDWTVQDLVSAIGRWPSTKTNEKRISDCIYKMEIAIGIQDDIDKLMQNFGEQESLQFIDFAKIWRDMNFSLIFCGKSMKYTSEIAECALQYVTAYLDEDIPLQLQIAALYTWFGCYYTQRCRPRVKIRISTDQIAKLGNLRDNIKQNNILDAFYIYTILQKDNAFYYTYSCLPFSYGSISMKVYNESTREHQKDWTSTNPYVDALLKMIRPIQNTEDLEQHYNQMKNEIFQKFGTYQSTNTSTSSLLEEYSFDHQPISISHKVNNILHDFYCGRVGSDEIQNAKTSTDSLNFMNLPGELLLAGLSDSDMEQETDEHQQINT